MRAGDCVPGLVECAAAPEAAGPLPGLEHPSTRAQCTSAGLQHALSDSAVGPGAALGLAHLGPYGEAGFPRLATNLRPSDLLAGDVCGHLALRRHLLSGGQLDRDRHHGRTGSTCANLRADSSSEEDVGFAAASQVPGVAECMKHPRMDVNLEELDRVLDHAREAPLSEPDYEKLKAALHALVGMLPQPRTTEKTKAVLGQPETPAPKNDPEPVKGHGRNGAWSYTGAKKVTIPRRPTKMFRAGLYARVSTNDQQTLAMQNRAMREYATRRGWTIALQVREVNSGAAKRETREQLLEAARRREIDLVLVWRLDRWGRSVTDLLATLQELEHLGVGFISLTEALDLTTPTGRAMAGLLAIFAEFEREILRERTRAGLAHARENGKRLGRPATAGIHTAEIRKLHRAGVSKSEIARRLEIGRTSVRRILTSKRA